MSCCENCNKLCNNSTGGEKLPSACRYLTKGTIFKFSTDPSHAFFFYQLKPSVSTLYLPENEIERKIQGLNIEKVL